MWILKGFMKNNCKTRNIILALVFLCLGLECKKEPPDSPSGEITDTTSHNFVVTRIDTLGDSFSSANAVNIASENDIWVAGVFTAKDSANNYVNKYNLAHWNGVSWKMIAVPIVGYGNTTPDIQPLIGIKAFGDSSIFAISEYDSYARWDGMTWISSYADSAGTIKHLWARSPNDIYLVGYQGNVAHWDGTKLRKMMTGVSNPPLSDIWGDEDEVYSTGYGSGGVNGTVTVLLYYNGKTWITANGYDVFNMNPLSPNQYVGSMSSIYRKNKNSKLWLLAGTGNGELFEVESLVPFKAKREYIIQEFFPALGVRGNADNDLFLVSLIEGLVFHFNGKSWMAIRPAIVGYNVHAFAAYKNIFISVGDANGIAQRGLVVIGSR
jgi:hypothetical protein